MCGNDIFGSDYDPFCKPSIVSPTCLRTAVLFLTVHCQLTIWSFAELSSINVLPNNGVEC